MNKDQIEVEAMRRATKAMIEAAVREISRIVDHFDDTVRCYRERVEDEVAAKGEVRDGE